MPDLIAPAYFALPAPISVNSLFRNLHGRGRVASSEYKAWQRSTEQWLAAQSPLPVFTRRVSIAYFVGADGVSAAMDIGNTEKAYTDALVRAGVIKNDNRKYVASVRVAWVDGLSGCICEIAMERDVPALAGFRAALKPVAQDLIRFDMTKEKAA